MEFSTLNGYKVKDKKAIRYYDTVADMKSDTTLKNGMHVKTKGYYSVNDGGHGEYVIVDDETLVEDGVTHILNNGLRAKLIVNDSINIKQCGAKSDGSSSISSLMNFLIENNNDKTIYIPNGDYLVSETIYLDTATKIVGENKFKTRLFTNSAINIMENKNDDITVCFIKNLCIDGNNIGKKGIYLYRDNPNLTYNDSRTELRSLMIKKCTDWCLQIGDPNKSSNVIELVADDIYVHQYTGGGIYISRCSDSHFSNLRSGSGLSSTKPAIQVEGYNLQIINSKAFLSGTNETPLSGWVFNGGANIYAEIEAQANSKHGVEIKNTKDSTFTIISDKNSLVGSDYASILIDSIQNCIINGVVSNNVATADFNTTTGCKLVEPKKLTLNLQCNNDITNAIDLSGYNTNQLFTVNSKININGYEKQNITPEFNQSLTLPEGVTLTKINNESYLLEGSTSSDSNIWISGSYGSHTSLFKIDTNHIYDLQTGNSKVGMVLYDYTTNLGGGYNRKINGSNASVTGVMLQIKANVTYNDIISPKIISTLNI